MKFENAVTKVLREEGGYVNDPADSGGATNRGVTQNTYNAYRRRKKLDERPVRYATMVESMEIYEGIWVACRADRLPAGLNLMHFDFAVNAGNRRAALTLQEILGVDIDGKIGPITLKAAGEADVEEAIAKYAERRRLFYERLAARRPKDKKFLRGWILRTNRTETNSLKAAKAAKEIVNEPKASTPECKPAANRSDS